MTTRADEDFAGFVAARWPDLEAVALAAGLDPGAARELCTRALADVRAHWAQALDDGAPTATARRALLHRIEGWSPPEGGPGPALLVADPDDPVSAALLGALAREEPLVRAALAAGPVWEVSPSDLAGLAGRRGRDLAERLHAARARLLDAHRSALAAEGISPADHRLEDDLAALLAGLAAAQPAPPDPAGLVAHRTGRTRRRSLLLGGGGAALLGAVGWASARSGGSPSVASSTAPSAAGPLPPREAPRWRATGSWPARGALAQDPEVRVLVEQALPSGKRLLYADEVSGQRVVVTTQPSSPGAVGTRFAVWTGPPQGVGRLTRVEYGLTAVFDVEDVLVLGVPHPAGGVVLALAPPALDRAELSPVLRLSARGRVERSWTVLDLEAGVGAVVVDAPLGVAARIRCGGYDGPLPRPREWERDRGAAGSGESLLAEVADATGTPPGRLGLTVLESAVPTDLAVLRGARPTTGVLRLMDVTAPSGAVVRRQYLQTQDYAGRPTGFGGGAYVLPADRADAPALFRVDDGETTVLVSTPSGAATVQLVGTERTGAPASVQARVEARFAVLSLPRGMRPTLDRVVVRDARGRTLSDAPPLDGRYLYDLSSSDGA